jgi:hypothetical protein
MLTVAEALQSLANNRNAVLENRGALARPVKFAI